MCRGSAPKPDKQIGEAALQSAQTAREFLELTRQQITRTNERDDRLQPFFDKIVANESAQSDRNVERSDEQWQNYRQNFMPLEGRLAADAASFDTPERRAEAATRARADIDMAFASQERQNNRAMAAMGVSPDAGMAMANRRATDLAKARAVAGATTAARRQVEAQGMQMVDNAARFGRGLPSTGIAAGQAASGNASAAVGALGSQSSQYAQGLGSAAQFGGLSNSAQATAGNLYAEQSRQRLASSQSGGLLGDIGAAVGIGAQAYSLFNPTSDRNKKKDVRDLDGEEVLDGLASAKPKAWTYKPGVSDEGRHVGPMAQDMNKAFGDQVAPDGKKVDLISAIGLQHAAINELAKKVKRLEKAKKLEKA